MELAIASRQITEVLFKQREGCDIVVGLILHRATRYKFKECKAVAYHLCNLNVRYEGEVGEYHRAVREKNEKMANSILYRLLVEYCDVEASQDHLLEAYKMTREEMIFQLGVGALSLNLRRRFSKPLVFDNFKGKLTQISSVDGKLVTFGYAPLSGIRISEKERNKNFGDELRRTEYEINSLMLAGQEQLIEPKRDESGKFVTSHFTLPLTGLRYKISGSDAGIMYYNKREKINKYEKNNKQMKNSDNIAVTITPSSTPAKESVSFSTKINYALTSPSRLSKLKQLLVKDSLDMNITKGVQVMFVYIDNENRYFVQFIMDVKKEKKLELQTIRLFIPDTPGKAFNHAQGKP
jgi:hypothetical protein